MHKHNFTEYSKMEIDQTAIHSFAISSRNFQLTVMGNTKILSAFRMKPAVSLMDSFPYEVGTIALPESRPTSSLVKRVSMSDIFSKANIMDRQTITLDPLYAVEFSMQPMEVQATSVQWFPNGQVPAVTVLTNYSACDILEYDQMSNQYKKSVISFNNLLKDDIPSSNSTPKVFAELKKEMDMIAISACCWQSEYSGDCYTFFCSNVAGWIYAFEVNVSSWTAILKYKTNTKLTNINSISQCKDLLIALTKSGVMSVFKITSTGLQKVCELWTKHDRLSCPKVMAIYSEKHQKYFISTCKAAFWLLFVLSANGQLEEKARSYLGNFTITDFESISATEYVVTTFSGYVEHIQVNFCEGEVELVTSKVETDFDTKNYSIQGIAVSPNKIVWTFALLPIRLHYPAAVRHDHHSLLVSVASLNNRDPLDVVMKVGAVLKVENVIDAFAQIRMDILENNIAKDYQNYNPEPVQITNDFLNRLRIKLFIANAIGSHNIIRIKQRGFKNETEKTAFENLIQMVNLCRRLTHISSLPVRNDFQNLSGKCILHTLKTLQSSQDEDHETGRMKQIMYPLVDTIVEQSETLFENVRDKCVYCGAEINFDTLMCADNHHVQRCIISCVQLPIFANRACAECNVLVHDNEEFLRCILAEDDEIRCPYCGLKFISQEIIN